MSVTIVAMINGTQLRGTIDNTSNLQSNSDNSCPIDSGSSRNENLVSSQMIVLTLVKGPSTRTRSSVGFDTSRRSDPVIDNQIVN